MSSVAPIVTALIAGGGGVVGGALSVSGQILIEARRTRQAIAAEVRREGKELRLAGRLVVEELTECGAMIEQAAISRMYWLGPRELPTTTWAEYQTDVAAGINDGADWIAVTVAYGAINNLNWRVAQYRSTDEDIHLVTHGARLRAGDNTRRAWRQIHAAISALEKVMDSKGEPGGSRLHTLDEESRVWPFGDAEDFDEESASIAGEEAYREELQRWSEEA